MIMLFDSSAMTVELTLVDDSQQKTTYQWEAGRALARDMLQFLKQKLTDNQASFDSVTGIGVKSGPGSYTGLRIGLTVLNTLAESKAIPIVGSSSDNWADICLARLAAGENAKLVMPEYGGEAHVTSPRK
jgi:tRNA threonylcarbamoyladenosine biosynthesis protein TsaB